MSARSIMVLGTSSHVGKSLLASALCRIFAQQGYRVAPFKAQNMSLNSAATEEGLEIGRAQALQAEAAGICASVHMNPILLKPAGDMTSQIVVQGKVWGRLTASDYHGRRVEELMPFVRESYETLASRYEVLVLEGAGSPAEINLKRHDIVNMRIAEMADAACLLVGDIDRGGVFASILGTMQLLDDEEQARIRGFVINKFRGDPSLLAPGIRMMEDRIGKPCLGVVPYLDRLLLDEEDSLGLEELDRKAAWPSSASPERRLRVAVIALPSCSNFTDFDALSAEPSVSVRFCRTAAELRQADVVVLPGSKQTIDDLLWMREEGLDVALLDYAGAGLVVGLCGGMQMLGERILDPHGMETAGSVPGLGLLPIQTTMRRQKITSMANGSLCRPSIFGQPAPGAGLCGYEIHLGETSYGKDAMPFAELTRRAGGEETRHLDGCVAMGGRVFGSYLHGLFDEDSFRHAFLSAARAFHGLDPSGETILWKRRRDASLDRLAETVSCSLDLPRIFAWAGLVYRPEARAAIGK